MLGPKYKTALHQSNGHPQVGPDSPSYVPFRLLLSLLRLSHQTTNRHILVLFVMLLNLFIILLLFLLTSRL